MADFNNIKQVIMNIIVKVIQNIIKMKDKPPCHVNKWVTLYEKTYIGNNE